MLLVTYLYTVSEMRSTSDIRNWTITNQIFLGMSVKSVINIRFYKVPLNWSPNKICGKVFNGPWFSHFFTCLFSYLFLVLKRRKVTKLKTSKESLQLKRTKTNIPVWKRKSFHNFFIFFYFLCGFSFTSIHESQDRRGRSRVFL